MTTAKNPEIVKIQISSAGTTPTFHYCQGKTRKAAMQAAADYLGQEAQQARRMGSEIKFHSTSKLIVTYKNGNTVTFQIMVKK